MRASACGASRVITACVFAQASRRRRAEPIRHRRDPSRASRRWRVTDAATHRDRLLRPPRPQVLHERRAERAVQDERGAVPDDEHAIDGPRRRGLDLLLGVRFRDRFFLPVWKSTSVSGASFFGDDAVGG